MLILVLATTVASALSAASTPANTGKIAIDPGTVVRFETSMLGFFSMSGAFFEVSGTIDLNGPHTGDEFIDVTIRTGSVKTDDGTWQEAICDADFFNCAGFPEMRFQSTAIKPGAEGKMQVQGNLTMRGVTRPLILQVSYESIRDESGIVIAYKNFHGAGQLLRSEYGMTARYPLVGDEVTIDITGAATVAPQ